MAMVVHEKLYTFDEFWETINLPENADRRFEFEDGVIIEVGASSKLNTVTAGRIIYFLNAVVIPQNLGLVTAPDAGYKFEGLGGRYRQPDAAFISKQRIIDLAGTYFSFAPDLVVEVVSPDEDIFKKANEYLRAGTRFVWAVYAEDRMVYVMRLNEDGVFISLPYTIDDTLDGGDVLPNFRLPVRDIFPE